MKVKVNSVASVLSLLMSSGTTEEIGPSEKVKVTRQSSKETPTSSRISPSEKESVCTPSQACVPVNATSSAIPLTTLAVKTRIGLPFESVIVKSVA